MTENEVPSLSQVQLLFVVGPTACGKSDFAVELHELLAKKGIGSEILNCDSVQFFDGVEIGAAKPSKDLLKRAPHHLISHVPIGGSYSAGEFCRDAERIMRERVAAGIERFIGVGGSGFYVQALEKGMYDVPKVPDEIRHTLEKIMNEEGPEPLYKELIRRDPELSSQIHSSDRYRILRSLEILRTQPEGITLSEVKRRFAENRTKPQFQTAKIGLFRPRDILRKRVMERTRLMLEAGLIGEVRALREQGLGAWSPMQSVGYKESQLYLDGQYTSEELEAAIITATMQLAKRQMTWFKRDSSIQWYDTEQGFIEPLNYVTGIWH